MSRLRSSVTVPSFILAGALTAQNCNLLCNGDFEQGMATQYYPHVLDASQVPCWSTDATDNLIEVWTDQGYDGTYPYSGDFFAEIEANEHAALFQDFLATPGLPVTITFAHRARWQGQDVMDVEIEHDGVIDLVAQVSDDSVGWQFHSFNYTLPTGGSNTFGLRFNSISTGWGGIGAGNFIDDVHISLPGPQVSLSSTPAPCGNASGTATAVVTGGAVPYAYTWSPTAGAGASLNGLGPGTYHCEVTDANGCIDTASVAVMGSPGPALTLTSTPVQCSGLSDGTASAVAANGTLPYTYAWSPSGATGATVTGLGEGPHTCTVTDANGCSSTASVTITALPGPVLSLTSVPAQCNGSADGTATAAIAGGTSPYTYSWSPSGGSASTATGLAAGTYTCNITDVNGCSDNGTVQVVQPAPVLVSAYDATVCADASFTLQATASGGTPAYAFQWFPEGPLIQPDTTTTYTVTATDSQGCPSDTVPVLVSVPEFPAHPFTADTTQGCLPFCVTLQAAVLPSFTLTWDLGDGHSTTGTSPSHCYDLPGTYDVSLTLSDANGCSSTVTQADMLTAHAAPFAQFSASALTVTVDEPIVAFEDESINTVDRIWHFGDGSGGTSTDASTTFAFQQPGCWNVELVVTDLHGCTDADSVDICVKDLSNMYVPNSFTPDGDGTNDAFRVVSSGRMDGTFELSVYDRWGALLFSSDAMDKGWNGDEATTGLYVWKLSYHDADGFGVERTGHVTLLR